LRAHLRGREFYWFPWKYFLSGRVFSSYYDTPTAGFMQAIYRDKIKHPAFLAKKRDVCYSSSGSELP
jgi:hypothetical protein